MNVSESKWRRNSSEDEGDFRLCRNLRLFVPAKGVETATSVDPEFLQNSLSADERNHAFAAAPRVPLANLTVERASPFPGSRTA